jgi:sugar/nucleoside kinase (ribokinase family)
MNRLHAIGPKTVVITDGPAGAYASDGQNRLKMPPYPDPAPPFERTGAGDAFASTFVAAIMKGANIEGALQWAPINSMNVVQNVGAQKGLLTEKEIGELLQKAPDWYKPEPF